LRHICAIVIINIFLAIIEIFRPMSLNIILVSIWEYSYLLLKISRLRVGLLLCIYFFIQIIVIIILLKSRRTIILYCRFWWNTFRLILFNIYLRGSTFNKLIPIIILISSMIISWLIRNFVLIICLTFLFIHGIRRRTIVSRLTDCISLLL
jgi:hypothetical protein